jgi:hypothetical protein
MADKSSPTKTYNSTTVPVKRTGTPVVDDTKTPYVDPAKPKGLGEKNYAIAEKFAPNREKPTTADAVKGLLNLPSAMAAVDPQGLSSVAPMMYQMLGQIAAASSGSSQSSRKRVIEDALTGALSILSNKYSFEMITIAFDNALKNGGINQITEVYKDIVVNALANLYLNYATSTDGKFPEPSYTTVTTKMEVPPSPLVTVVPDLYVQQYYTPENDPYPGYILWFSQDQTEYVFTERQIGELYYSTPDEEIYSISERELANGLEPDIVNNNLTVNKLNDLLAEQDSNVDENSQEKTSGKNVATQAISLLMQLSGYAGVISNLQQKIQLPASVLNQGSIKKSTDAFMKNVAQMRQHKEKAKKGSNPVTGISTLLSAVGTVSSAVGAVSSIASTATSNIDTVTKISSLTGQSKNLYDTITKS